MPRFDLTWCFALVSQMRNLRPGEDSEWDLNSGLQCPELSEERMLMQAMGS
jgi:hypothetical protein